MSNDLRERAREGEREREKERKRGLLVHGMTLQRGHNANTFSKYLSNSLQEVDVRHKTDQLVTSLVLPLAFFNVGFCSW